MDSSRKAHEGLDLALNDAATAAPGPDGIEVRNPAGEESTTGAIDSAIHSVNSARGHFGATRNALGSHFSTLPESSTGFMSREGHSRDADLALETASHALVRILQDVTVALRTHRRIAGEEMHQLLRS